jgi:hypothetical protein
MKRISTIGKSGASYKEYLRSTGMEPLTTKSDRGIPMSDYLIYADYLKNVGMLPLTTIKKGTILFHGAKYPWNRFNSYSFFSETPNLAMGFGRFMWVGILTDDVSMVDFRDSDEPTFKSDFCDTIFDCNPATRRGISDRKNMTGYPSLTDIIESRGADGWIAKDQDDELNYRKDEDCLDKNLSRKFSRDNPRRVYYDSELVFRDPGVLKTICWLFHFQGDIEFGEYYNDIYQALLCTVKENSDMWSESEIEPIMKELADRWPCLKQDKIYDCRYWIHPRDYVDGKETETEDTVISSIRSRLRKDNTSIGVLYTLASSLRKLGWKHWPVIREVMISILEDPTVNRSIKFDITHLIPVDYVDQIVGYKNILDIPHEYTSDPFLWDTITRHIFTMMTSSLMKPKNDVYKEQILKIAPERFHRAILDNWPPDVRPIPASSTPRYSIGPDMLFE